MTKKIGWAKSATLIAATLSWPVVPLLADPGVNATISVSQRFEYNDSNTSTDPADNGFFSRTGLGFGIVSESTLQTLSFTAETDLLAGDGLDGVEIDNESAELIYSYDLRQFGVELGLSYDETDVDSSVFLDALTGLSVVSDEGDRQVFRYSADFRFGEEDVGAWATLSYVFRDLSYVGTTDPALVDSERYEIDSDVFLRVSPNTVVNVGVSTENLDEDDALSSERTTTGYTVGFETEVNAATTLGFDLFYDEAERTSSAGTTQNDGFGFGASWVRELSDGILSVSYEDRATIAGQERDLIVERSYETKYLDLSASLGLSQFEDGDLNALLGLVIGYEINRSSSLDVELSQETSIDDDDVASIRTSFDVDYTQELTSLADFSAGVSFASTDILGAGTDSQTYSVDLGFNYELGSDWDLVSGIQFTSSQRDDGSADRNSSTIFLGLEKDFEFRP